jgi:hypothetical protein
VLAFEAHLNGAIRQVARGFQTQRFAGEGVVGADVALFLDKEQFVVGLIGREKAHAVAVQGRYAQDGMDLGIVVFFGPVGELAVEGLRRREVQLAAEGRLADPAKKPLHFSLGRSVPYGRVGEPAADAGANRDDFLGGVDGAVIDVAALGHPAFVEGGA